MNFKYFTKQKIALESIDSGRTILSVVPPEFTSNEVHSYPVTGMTGGAFPSRSSKAPSPMIKQGLAPSAPSLRFDHRVLFLFTAFAIGDYSIIFFPSCQGLYTPLPPTGSRSPIVSRETQQTCSNTPKDLAGGEVFRCVLCVF